MATEVNLDPLWEARFPDRCILCGCPGPWESFEVATRAGGGWSELVGIPGRRHAVKLPSCSKCRHLLERQRRLRNRGSLFALVLAAALYSALVVLYRGPHANYVWAAAIVLFMAPYVVWEGLFPLPFRMRATPATVTYVFEQEAYGREFALLNDEQNLCLRDALVGSQESVAK